MLTHGWSGDDVGAWDGELFLILVRHGEVVRDIHGKLVRQIHGREGDDSPAEEVLLLGRAGALVVGSVGAHGDWILVQDGANELEYWTAGLV